MDGQTDRQNRFGYYSGLHCEQCGRAVKTACPIVPTDTLSDVYLPAVLMLTYFMHASMCDHIKVYLSLVVILLRQPDEINYPPYSTHYRSCIQNMAVCAQHLCSILLRF